MILTRLKIIWSEEGNITGMMKIIQIEYTHEECRHSKMRMFQIKKFKVRCIRCCYVYSVSWHNTPNLKNQTKYSY